MVLRDECAAIPVGSYQRALGVTLSLPSVVGRSGVVAVLQPELTPDERSGLQRSAQSLKNALEAVKNRPLDHAHSDVPREARAGGQLL
jgi:L-lactate dehydrogenase